MDKLERLRRGNLLRYALKNDWFVERDHNPPATKETKTRPSGESKPGNEDDFSSTKG